MWIEKWWVRCALAVSPNNQTGRFPAGKAYILPEPRVCFTNNNHFLILVNAPLTIAALDVDSTQGTSAKKAEKMEAAPIKKSKWQKRSYRVTTKRREVDSVMNTSHQQEHRWRLKIQLDPKKHGCQEVFNGMRKFLKETCGTNEVFPTKETQSIGN